MKLSHTVGIVALFAGSVFASSSLFAQALEQNTQPEQPYDWRAARIVGGGFVTGIVFHPAAKDLAFVRTDIGGAYRWNAKTQRWQSISQWITADDWNYTGVESLAVDPSDPDRLFLAVGTYTNDWAGNGAMMRSTDGGVTWHLSPVPFKMGSNEDGRNNGERLAVDPNNGKILLFGSRRNGLWRSDDSGDTWTHVLSFPIIDASDGQGIVFVSFDARSMAAGGKFTPVVYAAISSTDAALYKSTDGGASWAVVPNQPAGLLPHRMAWGGGAMYITYGDQPGPNGNHTGAVWKFETQGGVWTDLTPQKATADDSFGYGGICVDPKHSAVLMVSTLDRWNRGDDIFRSTDDGKTWMSLAKSAQRDESLAPWLAKVPPANAPLGHWIADVRIDPFDSNHALFCTGWGLWDCRNLTDADSGKPTHWTVGSLGIEECVVNQVVSPPQGAQILSAMWDLGGFRHEDVNVSPVSGCFEPRHDRNTDIDFAALKPQVVARVWQAGSGTTGGAISLDNGQTWTEFAKRPKGASNGSIAVSADGSVLVWSPEHGTAARSKDHGATWSICRGLPDKVVVVADRVLPQNFYAFDPESQSVFVSTNGAARFVQASQDLPDAAGQLRAVPDQSGHLWLACSAGLFRSTDAGDSFTQLHLVQQAYKIGFGKPAPDQTYPVIFMTGRINGTYGIFRSDDEGATWVAISDALHKFAAINAITGDPRIAGRVYLATSSFGIVYGDPAPPKKKDGAPPPNP